MDGGEDLLAVNVIVAVYALLLPCFKNSISMVHLESQAECVAFSTVDQSNPLCYCQRYAAQAISETLEISRAAAAVSPMQNGSLGR